MTRESRSRSNWLPEITFLNNLRTRTRLNLGFGVILFFAGAISVWGLVKLSQLNHATQEIVSRNWEKAALANQVANLAQESGLETLNLFSRGYISFDDDVASDF